MDLGLGAFILLMAHYNTFTADTEVPNRAVARSFFLPPAIKPPETLISFRSVLLLGTTPKGKHNC